jgi:hypothetical protein
VILISNLLGWKMYANNKAVTLAADEKASQTKRQQTTSAPALDAVALQEAPQEGKVLSFEATDEWVPLKIDEAWRETFHAKEQLPGGFAEAVLREPRLAKRCVGFIRLNAQSATAVVSRIGLTRLVEEVP